MTVGLVYITRTRKWYASDMKISIVFFFLFSFLVVVAMEVAGVARSNVCWKLTILPDYFATKQQYCCGLVLTS